MGNALTSQCGCEEDMEKYIKKFCMDRIERMGFYSVRSGACKSCPYRYRGSNTDLYCCMFETVPRDWEDVILEE